MKAGSVDLCPLAHVRLGLSNEARDQCWTVLNARDARRHGLNPAEQSWSERLAGGSGQRDELDFTSQLARS